MGLKLEFESTVSWGFKSVTSQNFLIRLILWTAVLILVTYLVFGSRYFGTYGAFLEANYALSNNPSSESAVRKMFSAMGSMMSVMLLLNLVFWCIIASAETAYHRNVFFGDDKGMFPLRFGKSELKLMLTHLCVILSLIGAYLLSILMVVLFFFIAAALSYISEILGAILMMLVALVGIVAAISLMLYVVGRLAPAGAMTIKTNRVSVMEAWRMTKGRVSPILFPFILILFIGYIVLMIVQFSTITAAFGGDSGLISVVMSSPNTEPSAVFAEISSKMSEIGTIIPIVIGAIILAIFVPIWYLAMWGVGNRAALVLDQS